MAEERKTKAMYFNELRELVVNTVEDQEKQDEYLEFIDKMLESIEKRKAAAKERAAKKRAESDALTDKIFEVLSYDYITVDDILGQLDEEGVTRNKVTSRLGKLIRNGKVEKDTIKSAEDNSKRMAYRKISEPTE